MAILSPTRAKFPTEACSRCVPEKQVELQSRHTRLFSDCMNADAVRYLFPYIFSMGFGCCNVCGEGESFLLWFRILRDSNH